MLTKKLMSRKTNVTMLQYDNFNGSYYGGSNIFDKLQSVVWGYKICKNNYTCSTYFMYNYVQCNYVQTNNHYVATYKNK